MDNTTNTAGEALDLNKTRAEFEAWAEGYFMCFVLHKAGEGYASTMTQAAWEAWCAALARAGSAAPAGQQAEPVAFKHTLPVNPHGVQRVFSDGKPHQLIDNYDDAFAFWMTYGGTLSGLYATPTERDAQDAARWRMLPTFFEEYQINALKLLRDIDAAIAAQPKDTTDTRREA